MSQILCIDTGTMKTGYCIIDAETYRPVKFGKIDNNEMLSVIDDYDGEIVVMERFAPQQHIGYETVTAMVWYGRFLERCYANKKVIHEIFRRDVKKKLLGKYSKADGSADSQLRKYLVKRFAEFDMLYGKGNKDHKDWFYGFASTDVYAAYCVGIVWLDDINNKKG